jgi:hypothetical protein
MGDATIAHRDYLEPRSQANRLQGLTTDGDKIFSIDNALRHKIFGRQPAQGRTAANRDFKTATDDSR